MLLSWSNSHSYLQLVILLWLFFTPLDDLICQHPNLGFSNTKSFTAEDMQSDPQIFDIIQDEDGMIYLANYYHGVLEYDGSRWDVVKGTDKSRVKCLMLGETELIYIGGDGSLGVIAPNDSGQKVFHSLANLLPPDLQPFNQTVLTIHADSNTVYFQTERVLIRYTPSRNSLNVIKLNEPVYRGFLIDNIYYISSYPYGLQKLTGNTFEKMPGETIFERIIISDILVQENGEWLLFTQASGIYIYNPSSGTNRKININQDLSQQIEENIIVEVTQTKNKDLLVNTLYGGLFLLGKDFSVKAVFNKTNGVIDDIILCHFYDKDGNIWFGTDNGLSRINILNSFPQLTRDHNITGKINDVGFLDSTITIASASGLYYLNTITFQSQFREIHQKNGMGIGQSYTICALENQNPKVIIAGSRSGVFVINESLGIKEYSESIDRFFRSRDIIQSNLNPEVIYIAADFHIHKCRYHNGSIALLDSFEIDFYPEGIYEENIESLWSWAEGDIHLYNFKDKTYRKYSILDPNEQSIVNIYGITQWEKSLLAFSNMGIYMYDKGNDRFVRIKYPEGIPFLNDRLVSLFRRIDQKRILISCHDADYLNAHIKNGIFHFDSDGNFIGFQQLWQIPAYIYETAAIYNDKVYYAVDDDIFIIDLNNLNQNNRPYFKSVDFRCIIRRIDTGDNESIFLEASSSEGEEITEYPDLILPKNQNTFDILWTAPYFSEEAKTKYRYTLQKRNPIISSDWKSQTSLQLLKLNPGSYKFQVEAMNHLGVTSPPAVIHFNVPYPWYMKWWASILYLILITISLWWAIRLYNRKIIRDKTRLEKAVNERTREIQQKKAKIEAHIEEIEAQRDEIEAQRDEIEAQRDSIYDQKEEIANKNISLQDSIRYARRIQDAVLPSPDVIQYLLPKHFIYYRPRDIVSGDFYWIGEIDNSVLVALGDCTGHGVPGAFMSVLGVSLLSEIVSNSLHTSTNEIMNELRDRIITSLKQKGESDEAKDGVDMSLIKLNMKNHKLEFTGAHQNLYLFQEGVLKEIKGDRMPVGIHTKASKLFKLNTIQLRKGDTIYVLSDGFVDQFGGPNGKKYGIRKLRTFLTDIQDMIMLDQLRALSEKFETWQGEQDQIDDVLVIGIRI